MNGDPNPADNGTWHTGALELEGTLDWWRLDHPGQYLIGLSRASDQLGFRVTVYHQSNMSEPVKNDRDERFTVPDFGDLFSLVGSKYVLLNPPYYVKVWHPDHVQTGTYSLAVHRLSCTNKYAMACILYPNQYDGSYKFPANNLVSSSPTMDSLYFHFDIQRPLAAVPQTARTVVSNYHTNKLATFIVGPHNDATWTQYESATIPPGPYPLHNRYNGEREVMNGFPISNVVHPQSWPDCPFTPGVMGFTHFPGCNNVIQMSVPWPDNPLGERRFLRVTRVNQSGVPFGDCNGGVCAEISFQPTWQTNLTVLPLDEEYQDKFSIPDYGSNIPDHELVCYGQDDDTTAEDEMRLRMLFDSAVWLGGYRPDDWGVASYPPGQEDVCDEYNAFWIGLMDDGKDAFATREVGDALVDLETQGYAQAAPRRFVQTLQIDFVEEDTCPSGGNPPGNLPEEASMTVQALSIDDYDLFTGAAGWVRKWLPGFLNGDPLWTGVGAGWYGMWLNLNHGTQNWEDAWNEGNIASDCVNVSTCTLTASTHTGSNVKENAVVSTGFYQSITTSTPFWRLAFINQPKFVSAVQICPAPGLASSLDSISVEVSEDAISWEDVFVPTFPPSAACLGIDFGMKANFVRIRKTVSGFIAIGQVEILGY